MSIEFVPFHKSGQNRIHVAVYLHPVISALGLDVWHNQVISAEPPTPAHQNGRIGMRFETGPLLRISLYDDINKAGETGGNFLFPILKAYWNT